MAIDLNKYKLQNLDKYKLQGATPGGFPTEEPPAVKQSFMQRLNGAASRAASQTVGAASNIVSGIGNVANALTSSEQTLGRGLSTVGSSAPGQIKTQNSADFDAQQKIINAIHTATDPVKKQHLTDFLKQQYGTDYQAPTASDINPALDMSNKEVLGAAAGTALDIVTAGSLNKVAQSGKILKAAQPVAQIAENLSTGAKLARVAKNTAKLSAKGAVIGYGYDVANKLQEDKDASEAFKPGWGTALGAGIPAVFGAYQAGKISIKTLGPRIDNSLIKPLLKDFRYGKNPGKTMAEMGIVANSQDELVTKLRQAKQKVGAELGQTAQTLEAQIGQTNPVAIDLSKSLSPLDDAIQQAATNNDQTLLDRIQKVKTALTQKLTTGLDEKGNVIIQSAGERSLQGGFANALEMKRLVGTMTKWTGNPTEDKLINKALKEVYSGIDNMMMAEARKASPELAASFEKLNGQYADLLTGEIAAKHTYELTQRQNLVSLPIKVGTATGIITAIATGGAAIPAILAGVGAGALEKALSSTAVKTRVASWLSKESPGVIEKLVRQNPSLQNVLYNTFIKENDIVDKKVLKMLKDIKTNGVPVGLSIKNVSANALDPMVDTGSAFNNRLNKYETQALANANDAPLTDRVQVFRSPLGTTTLPKRRITPRGKK